MSIPIKSDTIIVGNLSGTNIFADYVSANGQISGQNIYQTSYKVIDTSQTGLFYPASNPSGFTSGGGGAGVSNIYEIRFFT
jgi:hypothetical protein